METKSCEMMTLKLHNNLTLPSHNQANAHVVMSNLCHWFTRKHTWHTLRSMQCLFFYGWQHAPRMMCHAVMHDRIHYLFDFWRDMRPWRLQTLTFDKAQTQQEFSYIVGRNVLHCHFSSHPKRELNYGRSEADHWFCNTPQTCDHSLLRNHTQVSPFGSESPVCSHRDVRWTTQCCTRQW